MKKLTVAAKLEKLDDVLRFIDEVLEENGCSIKAQMQLDVAVEELFVNIAHYAYDLVEGHAEIELETGGEEIVPEELKAGDEGKWIRITLIDSGVPFNPLKKPDPDITLSAQERQIGGLGIFMVKKSMNHVVYDYRDGKNILSIYKKIG